jgi:pimeloyl-ACP methyl ester carboxylesterase
MRVRERREHVVSREIEQDVLLTIPASEGRHPAIAYLPALGTRTLVCDLETSALGALIVALTAAGFVTLRAEPAPHASLDETLARHSASLDWLASLAEVDPERVFAFGHSLGGILAPHLSAKTRGIVAYGAPSRAWSECLALGARRQLALFGLAGEELEREARAAARLYHEVFEGNRDPVEVLRDDSEIAASRAARDVRNGRLFERDSSFHHALQRLDLEGSWRSASDVLAIQGEHDWVVEPDDHVRISGWAKRGSARTLVGLDHWMQRHASVAASFQKPGRGVVDPNWAEPVIEWLREESG